MVTMVNPIDRLRESVNKANELDAQIANAVGSEDEKVSALLDTAPEFAKFRETLSTLKTEIETLEAKITNGTAAAKEKAAKMVRDSAVDEGFDLESTRAELLKARQTVTAQVKALRTYLDSDEDLETLLKENDIVIRKTRTAGAKSVAGNTRRPRIATATVDGENVAKDDGSVDFTYLAKKVGNTDADTLKKAAFAAAGTEDLNSLGAGHVVNFESGGKKFSVTISDKKPGRKAAE